MPIQPSVHREEAEQPQKVLLGKLKSFAEGHPSDKNPSHAYPVITPPEIDVYSPSRKENVRALLTYVSPDKLRGFVRYIQNENNRKWVPLSELATLNPKLALESPEETGTSLRVQATVGLSAAAILALILSILAARGCDTPQPELRAPTPPTPGLKPQTDVKKTNIVVDEPQALPAERAKANERPDYPISFMGIPGSGLEEQCNNAGILMKHGEIRFTKSKENTGVYVPTKSQVKVERVGDSIKVTVDSFGSKGHDYHESYLVDKDGQATRLPESWIGKKPPTTKRADE